MRVCPKCSKQVSGESKICRDCGAILEDVGGDALPESRAPTQRAIRSGSPFAVGPQAGGPGSPPAAEPEDPVVAELVRAEGAEAVAARPESAGEHRAAGGAAERDHGVEPAEPHAAAPGSEDAAANPPAQATCPRCGAAEVMRGVTVRDAGEGSSGVLQVVIVRNPDAMIFKDRLYGPLKADICGRCGHVELRVTNPKQLYQHYHKSPHSDPWAL